MYHTRFCILFVFVSHTGAVNFGAAQEAVVLSRTGHRRRSTREGGVRLLGVLDTSDVVRARAGAVRCLGRRRGCFGPRGGASWSRLRDADVVEFGTCITRGREPHGRSLQPGEAIRLVPVRTRKHLARIASVSPAGQSTGGFGRVIAGVAVSSGALPPSLMRPGSFHHGENSPRVMNMQPPRSKQANIAERSKRSDPECWLG